MTSHVSFHDDVTIVKLHQEPSFNSHHFCYTDNGFCTDILLSDTNLNCLAFEVFDSSDFWNEQAIQQVCNQ